MTDKEGSNYEDLMTADDMSEANKDHLSEARGMSRRSVQLTTFRVDEAQIAAKVDLLSKLLGAQAKKREALVKVIKKREKDPDFKQQYEDRNMVDREDYDYVMALFDLDQEIIPLQVILEKIAIHGFEQASSLVDVDVTLKESKVFTEQFKDMLANSYKEMLKIIDNNKTILDSVIKDYKSRNDESIKEISTNLMTVTKSVVKLQALMNALETRMDNLQATDRLQTQKMFGVPNNVHDVGDRQAVISQAEHKKLNSILQPEQKLSKADSDTAEELRKAASEKILKNLELDETKVEEQTKTVKTQDTAIAKNVERTKTEIGHTFDDAKQSENTSTTTALDNTAKEQVQFVEGADSKNVERLVRNQALRDFTTNWLTEHNGFMGFTLMLRQKFNPTEEEKLMIADHKTLLRIRASKEKYKSEHE